MGTSAAVAAGTAFIARSEDERRKAAAERTPAAAASNLVPQLERFSLVDDLNNSSNIVRSIIDNTIGESSIRSSATTSKSWWPEIPATSGSKPVQISTTVTATPTAAVTATAPVTTAANSLTDVQEDRDAQVREKLCVVFTPEQVDQIMKEFPNERDYNTLMYHANQKFFD